MAKAHVLVVPYPAQGHVIPMMELAQYLVKQGVKVTFINTEVNHKLVTSNGLHEDGFGDLIQMISISDGLEPWEDRSDLNKLTSSILEYMPDKLQEYIETVNKENSNKITCIIADGCMMAWAIQLAKKMRIKRSVFWPASVATLACIMSFQKLIDDGVIDKKGIPLNDQMIHLSETMPAIKSKNLTWCIQDLATTEIVFKSLIRVVEASRMTEWSICNSTTEIEPAAFSLYPQLLPIGPLLASNRLAHQAGHLWQEDYTCLAWLDQQPECSVIYIAFGSFTIFNQIQFEELALGLELSNRPFLWVVRPGMTKESTTLTAFPDGYIDRVGSRGRIVSWAPQQKVLAHPSVACFMSHCGWNSTLEGVTNGLPFLCWPYFGDQFFNETYICDIWKTGLGFNKDEAGVVTRGEIRSKVEQLLSDTTFRDKALDIKGKVTNSVREGGCSHRNLGNFIKWIQEEDLDAKDQTDTM